MSTLFPETHPRCTSLPSTTPYYQYLSQTKHIKSLKEESKIHYSIHAAPLPSKPHLSLFTVNAAQSVVLCMVFLRNLIQPNQPYTEAPHNHQHKNPLTQQISSPRLQLESPSSTLFPHQSITGWPFFLPSLSGCKTPHSHKNSLPVRPIKPNKDPFNHF